MECGGKLDSRATKEMVIVESNSTERSREIVGANSLARRGRGFHASVRVVYRGCPAR